MRKKKKKPSIKFDSDLEKSFYKTWCNGQRVKPEVHYKFHPVRQWEFDFCWPEHKVAVEIQGFGEGHNSYHGMKTDYEKFNSAVLLGWRILLYMAHHLKDNKHRREMIQEIGEALHGPGNYDYPEESDLLPADKRRREIQRLNRPEL